MVAIHCCHNCDERLHGFQVSALERRVGETQRLSQPRDLQMNIAVWGGEFATGDGGIDLASDRSDADLADFRDLFGTVTDASKSKELWVQASFAILRAFARDRSRARPDCGS